MQFFQYLAIAVVAFTGVIVGRILFFIAPEELDASKKWLRFCYAMAFALLILFSSRINLFRIIIAILGFSMLFWFKSLIGKDTLMTKVFISAVSLISGFVYAVSDNNAVSGSLTFVFFIFLSGFFLSLNPKNVDVKKGIVKYKLKYIKEILLLALPFFVSIPIYFIN